MTQKTVKIYKNLPLKINCKANGFWDYNIIKSYNDNTTEQITMKTYDGFSYVLKNSETNPNSFDFTTTLLPNYTYVDSQTAVFMPYDNDKIYHNTNVQEKNVYLVNNGCKISDTNIVSGFSSVNYLLITEKIPTFTNFKLIFKATTGSSLTDHHNVVFGNYSYADRAIQIRSTTSAFSYYTGSWVDGTTTLSPNTTYWFAVNYDGTNFIGYTLLDDGSYTIDTLPDFTSWTQEWTSTSNIFSGYTFTIGYNKYNTASYFSGTFDLNNCKIWIDGEPWWYYNMITEVSQDLKGCLYNYTDTGLATNLNCFYYNNKYLLTADENIENGLYLGQVEIPAHNVYTYSETPYQVYDNFTIMGTGLDIDQETGKVSGFSSSSYLDTGYIPSLPANTPWKMRVRFKYEKVNSFQVFLSGTTYANAPYIAVGTNYLIDCGISDGSSRITWIEGTTVLENGVNYIIEFSYDGNTTYTVRLKIEDGWWDTENTYTYDGKTNFGANLCVGRNGSGYARGIIDLSTDTYFEIDGVKTWIPTTTRYNVTWTKQ